MRWRNIGRFCILCSFTLIFSIAFSGESANQVVTYSVNAINQISVSGIPDPLVINTARTGSQPTEITDTSTNYLISSSESHIKIVGSIDSDLPPGVTLKINLAAPNGGASAGDVSLEVDPIDLVSGTTTVDDIGKTITYKLNATVPAGIVIAANKTVTLTMTEKY